MRDGFIKVACGMPTVSVANIVSNTQSIKELILSAEEKGVNLLVLPELAITGYTCGDLFLSDILISAAQKALTELAVFTKGKYVITIVGVPFKYKSKLFNCAAVLFNGEILGIVPKTTIPNHGEFEEKRYFLSASDLGKNQTVIISGKEIPIGTDIMFSHSEMNEYCFGVEICEDLWSPQNPTTELALSGALIIANPAASTESVGKAQKRHSLVSSASEKLLCGYIFSSASMGESTQDAVFSAHSMIYENGNLLAENKPFQNNKLIISEVDVKNLSTKRSANTSFISYDKFRTVYFNQEIKDTQLTRRFARNPFVPENDRDLAEIAENILQIQSYGLKKRLEHTGAKTAVIGISGGLDSTLALLAAVRAMKLANRPMSDILAITMPCFGTTRRTRSNSEELCRLLGVTFKEVNITNSVLQHFDDIGQNVNSFDVTYENSQARERTQVLMDIANKTSGLVIGTGDLSELALGWATYNGDHMSMYGVNSGVPKTLIRSIIQYEALNSDESLKKVLFDIWDTPVSPELLPADHNGEIAQKTEDLVGPYELHDFFLYHTVHLNESPAKIFRLAKLSFDDYPSQTIYKWMCIFAKRFFNQQFKRSCLPDGPKVGSVCLSPRGAWKMPSDASSALWIEELQKIAP